EMVVLGVRQRGGDLRLIPVKDAKMSSLEPELVKHISPDATLQTDKALVYDIIGQRRFVNHRMIDHIRTYVEGENHTNTVENAFSDRKSTRLNSSHGSISYAVFCLKKKKKIKKQLIKRHKKNKSVL